MDYLDKFMMRLINGQYSVYKDLDNCRSNGSFDALNKSQHVIYASSDNDQLYLFLLGSDPATVNLSSANPSNTGE